MKLRKPLAILGLVGTVAAMSVVGTAFAQTPAPSQEGKTSCHELFMDRLANALGTTQDKLNSAFTQARNETVDQQVKDGKLTQERADKIKAQEGTMPFGFGGRGFDREHRGGAPFMMGGSQLNEAIAGALGITTDELSSQLKSGKSLADLAAGKEQAVKDAIVGAVKSQMDQAVKDGKMTQEQADKVLERVKSADLNSFGGRWGRDGTKSDRNPTPTAKPSSGRVGSRTNSL